MTTNEQLGELRDRIEKNIAAIQIITPRLSLWLDSGLVLYGDLKKLMGGLANDRRTCNAVLAALKPEAVDELMGDVDQNRGGRLH